MNASASDNRWAVACAKLHADPDAFTWPQRMELAAELRQDLGIALLQDSKLALAFLLAEDSKPEVRKEIAEALIHLPDEEFAALAALLSQDSNAYVKQAAERAIARRQRGAQQTRRTRNHLATNHQRMDRFEDVFGPVALKQAQKIADEQFEALVRQTLHDIRNILSPIRIDISVLRRRLERGRPDPKLALEKLHTMGREMDYVERFLNDLEAYAMATPASRRRERLLDIVSDARKMAEDKLKDLGLSIHGVRVEVKVSPSLSVYVARHQVLMALVHVLKNSIEALAESAKGKRKSAIQVAAELSENVVTVTVRDNGPGIEPDLLKQLRAFVPGKLTRKPTGSGFGLPTAARYIFAQGGSLSIDSEKRKGTVVRMTLPVMGEDGDEA